MSDCFHIGFACLVVLFGLSCVVFLLKRMFSVVVLILISENARGNDIATGIVNRVVALFNPVLERGWKSIRHCSGVADLECVGFRLGFGQC